MKKIILSFMLLSSFLFGGSPYTLIFHSSDVNLPDGRGFTFSVGSRSTSQYFTASDHLYSLLNGVGFYMVIYDGVRFFFRYYGGNKAYIGQQNGEDLYLTSYWDVNAIEHYCATGQIVQNGVCTNPPPPPPQCGEGTYLNPATLSCAPIYPIADEETLESGSKNIIFEDGAMMIVNPDGTAVTFAPDGAKIPNRLYNGSIPEVGYLSESKNIGVNGSDFFTVNPLGIFLKSSALFAIQNTALLWHYAMSDQKETANGDVVDFKPTMNGVAVNISQKAFDNIDFSEYENKATTTPQSVPNSDLAYKKLSDAEILQFLGATKNDTVFYKPNDPSYFVASNSDSVSVVKANPDGSAQKVEIQKNDLQNTATNNTDLQVTQTTISAPKINNDGTTSTTTNTSVGSVSTATNTNTTTSSNGSTSTVNPTTGTSTNGAITPSSDGTGSNINLSGVTSRLDKISNQLTKQNERNEQLDKIGDNAYSHGIPTGGTSPYDWTSHQATFENLKSTIDDLNGQADEIKALFQNGFTLNLSGTPVDTCPYNSTIDLDGRSIAVSFDLCKTFSPMRPLFHGFFYLFFVFVITSFGVKSILRFA